MHFNLLTCKKKNKGKTSKWKQWNECERIKKSVNVICYPNHSSPTLSKRDSQKHLEEWDKR